MGGLLPVDCEPGLVEAAVLAAVARRGGEAELHRERDRLYEIADAERREAAFTALHSTWFERLGLGTMLERALGELPDLAAGCARCVLARASGAATEHADLRAPPGAAPTLVVHLRPETLADPPRALRLLRHELRQIADMLDPAFGYDRDAAGAMARGLALRCRVAWAVWVDGRLWRRAQAPPTARDDRRRDFVRAFPELDARGDAAFERLFEAERVSHAELMALAAGDSSGAGPARCGACGMPARDLAPAGERLPDRVRAAITERASGLAAGAGICGRCVEVYLARYAGGGDGRGPR